MEIRTIQKDRRVRQSFTFDTPLTFIRGKEFARQQYSHNN